MRLRKELAGLSERWDIVEPDSSGNDVGLYTALVVDHYHRAQIAYYDYHDRTIKYYVEPHFLDYSLPPSISADSDTNDDVLNPVILDNHTPVANDVVATTAQDISVAITLNASDQDGDYLTYTIIAEPSDGALSGTAPELTYSPDSGFIGTDTFTFKVNDGTVDSNTATVTIIVTQPPDTTAPTNQSVLINNGNNTTYTTTVTLSLYAKDDTGVTAYYLSKISTTPAAYDSNWISITSTKVYSDDIFFTLSSGNGVKTVYVWYKDWLNRNWCGEFS